MEPIQVTWVDEMDADELRGVIAWMFGAMAKVMDAPHALTQPIAMGLLDRDIEQYGAEVGRVGYVRVRGSAAGVLVNRSSADALADDPDGFRRLCEHVANLARVSRSSLN